MADRMIKVESGSLSLVGVSAKFRPCRTGASTPSIAMDKENWNDG